MAKNNLGKSTTSKWWATIIYNDCDISLIDKALKGLHIRCALSPLHDRDFKYDYETYYEEDVDIKSLLKEPHYHLLVCFDNSIGEKSFRYLLEHNLPSYIHWKGALMIGSEKGYGRYLIHLDDLDKAQYRREDILYYCGYDDSILESPKKSEKQKNEDLRLFIQLIHDWGIEDMMTLYEVVMMSMPHKIDVMLRFSSQLEKFTRGQYQKELRKERVMSAYALRQNTQTTTNG